ncbi:hypothetical protein AU377_02780 [Sporosarcina sp. HYO08]|nr:hypothetical protein AU377_02780 [Sporosarcina sp. HYO08]
MIQIIKTAKLYKFLIDLYQHKNSPKHVRNHMFRTVFALVSTYPNIALSPNNKLEATIAMIIK